MPLNILDCDDACHTCVRGYAKKHSFKPGEKFDISCKGIPKEFVDLETISKLNTDINAAVVLDPIQWAAEVLDWHCLDPEKEVWARKNPEEFTRFTSESPDRLSKYHRPYQATLMRCTSKYKVFRSGRQIGKCLVSDTQISMADGTFKYVQDIKDGDLVLGINENTYKTETASAYLVDNGLKDSFKLELSDGRSIEATDNHPFLTRRKIGRESFGTRKAIFEDKWEDLSNLTKNHYVAVPVKTLEPVNPVTAKKEELIALGYMLGDGNCLGKNLRFSNIDWNILEEFNSILLSFNSYLKHFECDKKSDFHIVSIKKYSKNYFKEWLKTIGIHGLSSHSKTIPNSFMQLKNEQTAILLSRMFACDGWANSKGLPQIGYSTVSSKLADQVISLLSRFGIYASKHNKKTKLKGKVFKSFQLTINEKSSISIFKDKIGIFSKEASLEQTYKNSCNKKISFRTNATLDEDLKFIKVKSITSIGQKQTWDLSVPKLKNFIANNIVTHNTEVMAILALFNLFTNSGFHIILLTPFQSQIDLVFKRLEDLITNNPALANSIKRSVKSPQYTITLHNGSQIKGFTAGTKSGQGAASVRGQSANMILLDEGDYLDRADIDSAMAIITNFPDAQVILSSTPSGRREKFYETCNSRLWKEFHYPSHINPNWTQTLDNMFREQLTKMGYDREILAEFGEQEQGVFQAQYVESAIREYKYSDVIRENTWLYSIGVDWNSPRVGTTVYVTGFNPILNKFTVVDTAVVQRAGWTQTAACEKIIEFNRKWRPFSVYVDKGFGGMQYEVLRKFALDSLRDPEKGPHHPDGQLLKALKDFDFGSAIEVRDPFTKELRKKPAKGFLVENAVRRFESGDIILSSEDAQLKQELLGYIVKNINNTGQVIYAALDENVGDHNLDALMLSLVAFTLEKSSAVKLNVNERIQYTSLSPPPPHEDIDPMSKLAEKPKPDQLEKNPKPKIKSRAIQATGTSTKQLWDWPGFGSDKARPRQSEDSRVAYNRFKRNVGPGKRSSF